MKGMEVMEEQKAEERVSCGPTEIFKKFVYGAVRWAWRCVVRQVL